MCLHELRRNLRRAHFQTSELQLKYFCEIHQQRQSRAHTQVRPGRTPAQKQTLWCVCTAGPLQLSCRAKQTSSSTQLAVVEGGGGAGRVRGGSPGQDLWSAYTRATFKLNAGQLRAGVVIWSSTCYRHKCDLMLLEAPGRASHCVCPAQFPLKKSPFFHPCL